MVQWSKLADLQVIAPLPSSVYQATFAFSYTSFSAFCDKELFYFVQFILL